MYLLRIILASSILFSALPSHADASTHTDWAKVTKTNVKNIVAPTSVKELQLIVCDAASKQEKIAILGAGYSQGGQTAYTNGIVIDMKNLKAITQFDSYAKTVSIQAGATWYDLLSFIDPHDLSIKTMQSYYNFSIGGSLSVNVHGRNMAYGQLIESVESIKVILADGSLVTASRHENYDLFCAAIGGYGYVGIIVEATFSLTSNCKLMRKAELIPVKEYKDFFESQIKNNPDVIMHNGDLYPNDYQQVMSISWYKTNAPLTVQERLQMPKKFYPWSLLQLQILRRINKAKEWRTTLIDPKSYEKEMVALRNFILAHNTQELKSLIRYPSTDTLQEYFIPCESFEQFVEDMKKILTSYEVNVLNCSIRYVKQNQESLLSYASRKDCFSLVLFISITNSTSGKQSTEEWTQALIDKALTYGGSFYLPYMLNQTQEQLFTAYPYFSDFLSVKNKYDATNVFSNELFRKYVEC